MRLFQMLVTTVYMLLLICFEMEYLGFDEVMHDFI